MTTTNNTPAPPDNRKSHVTIMWIFFGLSVFTGVGASVKNCDGLPGVGAGGSHSILPPEVHVRKDGNGNPTTPEYQAKVLPLVKACVQDIADHPVDEASIFDIDEIWPVYMEGGKEKVGEYIGKELEKRFEKKQNANFFDALSAIVNVRINFPLLDNGSLKLPKFLPVALRYKTDGVDLSKEVLVDTGLLGTDGNPVYLPKHFWKMLQEAAKEAKVEPKIAWGTRDHNLQCLMNVRTTLTNCDDNYYDLECRREVSRTKAGKPDKFGITHLFSADIDNWKEMEQPLLDRGFAVGCAGLGEDDMRHTTWGISPKDSRGACKAMKTWNDLKKVGKKAAKKGKKALRGARRGLRRLFK